MGTVHCSRASQVGDGERSDGIDAYEMHLIFNIVAFAYLMRPVSFLVVCVAAFVSFQPETPGRRYERPSKTTPKKTRTMLFADIKVNEENGMRRHSLIESGSAR